MHDMFVKCLVVVILAIIIVVISYASPHHENLVRVTSNVDGRKYEVRDVPDAQRAANMLARMRLNAIKLSDDLAATLPANHEMREYTDRLHKIKHADIAETPERSTHTSFSVNKGERIVFCIRDVNGIIHDMNLIMYIVLHELAHVACPIYDNHGPLFRKIFAFICTHAISTGMYHRIDFKSSPANYCGLQITESIV